MNGGQHNALQLGHVSKGSGNIERILFYIVVGSAKAS